MVYGLYGTCGAISVGVTCRDSERGWAMVGGKWEVTRMGEQRETRMSGERESISLFIGISRIKKIIDVSKDRYFLFTPCLHEDDTPSQSQIAVHFMSQTLIAAITKVNPACTICQYCLIASWIIYYLFVICSESTSVSSTNMSGWCTGIICPKFVRHRTILKVVFDIIGMLNENVLI